jgi:hypothetical protein
MPAYYRRVIAVNGELRCQRYADADRMEPLVRWLLVW